MRRLLAFFAAGLLIVAAMLVRSRLDAREADQAADAALRGTVVCVPEAQAACDALRAAHPDLTVRTEEAGTTLERLWKPATAPADAGFDAWIAPAPYALMVAQTRDADSAAPITGTPSRVLARSPVTLTAWTDAYQRLRAACPDGAVTWACIGAVGAGGVPGTEVNATLPTPDTSATGLLVLAQGAGQALGRPDYASNDLDTPAFDTWLQGVDDAVVQYQPAGKLPTMIAQGPSAFDVAGGLEREAGPAVASAAKRSQLTVLYPEPVATADLVLVPIAGSSAGTRLVAAAERGETDQALAAAGWRVDGQPAATGVGADPLPATSQLPNAGTLQTLRDRWKNR